MTRASGWDQLARLVSAKRSWVMAVLIILASGALIGLSGTDDSASQSPEMVPPSADSAQVDELRTQFPGGDQAPAILVLTRSDGATLSPADVEAAEQSRQRTLAAADQLSGTQPSAAAPPAGPPVLVSDDDFAAVATVPLSGDLSGFDLTDAVEELRAAAADGLPAQLQVEVTGGPAFGADIADSFSGANITLLVVTALVVAVLLIITYRSPVLWLVPLTVIAVADRAAAVLGSQIADVFGLVPDGSTSGITSVLVFGAGTNYSLLLISRYREELGRDGERSNGSDHRAALRVAVRNAGPAILASNATVVLALLTLLFAVVPSTRSLGLQAASGLLVAAVFVLLVLPPLLALFGRRLFWPFIPQPGAKPLTDSGAWRRIADWVAQRPGKVVTITLAALVLMCTGLLGTPIGLSQTEQFRVQAESVSGYETLAAHFPRGLTDPTHVVASTDRAGAVERAINETSGVVSATEAGRSDTGLTQWSVVLDAEPASDEAFETVDALRESVRSADSSALVGGSDAQARDASSGASRDRLVLIPAILAVVLVVLYVLLRSALAPPVLVAVSLLSSLAALGLGGWISVHAFGFPALDYSTPLFALLFLVALGVDYTIFLVTRAREETVDHGTRGGIVRAVSATGAVITSAGIVLAAVFCVLGVLPLIVLTQLGIIVGIGILLDTFVVRTVIVPALFTLIGPRIWWPSLRPEK